MESTTIKALFGRRNIRFVIPEYQRAYAWGERQFSQFVEDLRECEENYYLGHFLFEQSDDTLYVIDGQQRLTTCIIFFSTLVNALKHRHEEWDNNENADDIKNLLEDITDYYLKDIRRNKQKFMTVPYDNNFFVDAVIENKESVSEEDLTSKSRVAMYKARTYFETELKESSVQQILSWVNTLENASITTFIVKDKLQAAQIFAYQNDRGKKLTNLEVLKAYFMLQIFRIGNNEDDIHYIEKAFEEIYHNIVLVSVDEDNVLNYYWRAVGPKGYYSEKVVGEVKDWLKSISREEQNLTFRSLIRGGRADITSRLQNVIQNANDTESFNKQIDSVKWKLNNDWWWGYWSDTEMLNHVRSGWFYGNRVDNYLLWRYEQYLCNDNYPTPKVSYSDVISNESIEHIAPQTQANPLENGYGVYEDKENPEEGIVSGEWMNCVGNLMLMAGRQNSSLGNRPFADKLQVYGRDNLLNQQKEIIEFVTDKEHPVWDKSSIERRFNKIVSAVKEIWNLNNI